MSRRRELVDLLEQVPLLSRCSQRERATVALPQLLKVVKDKQQEKQS